MGNSQHTKILKTAGEQTAEFRHYLQPNRHYGNGGPSVVAGEETGIKTLFDFFAVTTSNCLGLF